LILFGIFAKPFRYAASALTPADLITSCVRLVSWTHSSVPMSHCGICAPRKPSTVYRNGTPGKACIRNRETESQEGGLGMLPTLPPVFVPTTNVARVPSPSTIPSPTHCTIYFQKCKSNFDARRTSKKA
jgi:hypothetical protein